MNQATIRRSHQDAADSFIARAVAIFVIAMAAQSVGEVLAQSPQVAVWWLVVLGGSIACSGSWVAVSGLLGRSQRLALTIFALAAVVGLGLWPVAHPAAEVGAPWVWNVLGLCVACIAAAWGQRLALAYTAVTAVVLTIVRLLPSGGAAGWATSLQDTTFLVTAGLGLTAAIQAVRVGAERADASALAAANAHHASAVARARLIERHRLGAILHDSVLTALVSAARAQTPAERQAAAGLAATSLRRIEDYGPVGSAPITRVSELPDRLRSTAEVAALLPVDIYARLPAGADGEVRGATVEALVAAVHAAVDNASRHSGAERITIRLSLDSPSTTAAPVTVGSQLLGDSLPHRLRVEICDDGRGFDPATVSPRCLGVRLSIIQRMLDAGGSAVIDSAPEEGTRVLLECEVDG